MQEQLKSSIVVYFSHSGITKQVAKELSIQVGADTYEIVSIEPYPSDYRQCTEQAAKEKKSQARPAMANKDMDFSKYDTIYLGFPNWWSTAPMIIFSFLNQLDGKGKLIVPFMTHGGGYAGDAIMDLQQHTEATVREDALIIQDSDVRNCQRFVTDWLSRTNQGGHK